MKRWSSMTKQRTVMKFLAIKKFVKLFLAPMCFQIFLLTSLNLQPFNCTRENLSDFQRLLVRYYILPMELNVRRWLFSFRDFLLAVITKLTSRITRQQKLHYLKISKLSVYDYHETHKNEIFHDPLPTFNCPNHMLIVIRICKYISAKPTQ